MTLHLERAPYFRGLLRRQKVAISGQYAGEMRHTFDGPNYMKSYVAKRGLRLDEVGQLLWDCGITESRPGHPDEVLEILTQALTYKPERKSSTTGGDPVRVLIACEFSGIVRDAFAALGHDAQWGGIVAPCG